MKHPRYILIILLLIICISGITQTVPLSLSESIRKALEENYGITISRAELDIASTNNYWGVAGRYPTLGFDASVNNSFELNDNTFNNRISGGIGINWILFDGFRVNITKGKLENTEDLTSGRLAIIIENTIEDIILGYYEVLLEEERLKVLKTVMDLSKDRYDYELKRKSLGSSVTYEVLQAENLYLSDKAAYLDQEMRVRNARRNFNFLLAAEPEASWDFSEIFEGDTTHFNLPDLQEKMISNNQTLKNQYTNLLLKRDEIRLRESAYYPTVSTSIGMDNFYSNRWSSSNLVFNASSYSPYGNLRLSYDIYSGGTRKRALQIAKIGEEIAQVEIERMEHALTNELFNLFDYHEVRIALLHVASQSYKAAELNLHLSEEKYRTGVINSFNYRDVQLLYLESSYRKLQAIYNLIDSRARLTRITGGFIQVEGAE
jgi:outer membrane protein TolC